jgi:hypothetical protein
LQLPPFEFVKLAFPSFLCRRSWVACDICDLHRKKRLCHQRRDQQRRLSSLQQLKWQRVLLRAAILLDWTRYIFSFPWEFNESIEPKHKTLLSASYAQNIRVFRDCSIQDKFWTVAHVLAVIHSWGPLMIPSHGCWI